MTGSQVRQLDPDRVQFADRALAVAAAETIIKLVKVSRQSGLDSQNRVSIHAEGHLGGIIPRKFFGQRKGSS